MRTTILGIIVLAWLGCGHAQAQNETIDHKDNHDWLNKNNVAVAQNGANNAEVEITQAINNTVSDRGAALRVGFVNFRGVMSSIPQLTRLRTRLGSEFSQQEAALNQQADEIKAMENKLADMPRGDAYAELEKQLIAKRRTFTRINASFRDAYSVRRNEELATLQQLVVDEIVNLAKEQNYDVILNDTGVIFVSNNVDLTSVVIERLNRLAEQGQNGN